MSKLIYIADDDIITCEILEHILTQEGYRVGCFNSGDALYSAFAQEQCDLVLLDVAMPGNDGFMVGMKIKQSANIPILILTGMRVSDDDYAFGISLGFDAYFTKPINSVKLIAHIRSLLIRADMARAAKEAQEIMQAQARINGQHPQEQDAAQETLEPGKKAIAVISYGDVSVYPERFTAFVNKRELQLTNIEFNLLVSLIKNQNRAISRLELLDMVWGRDSYVGPRAADDIIKRLRRKLKQLSSNVEIGTVYGFGFRLSVEEV